MTHDKDRTGRVRRRAKLGAMAISAAAAMLLGAVSAHAYTGQEMEAQAKIKVDQARSIALKAQGGKIIDEELEKEAGGSGLRYSFDIRKNNVTHEVGVDAQTGKVIENAEEGPHPD